MTLPSRPFAVLAVDLGIAARKERDAIVGVDLQLYRLERTGGEHDAERMQRVREMFMAEATKQQASLDEAHELLRALAEHEQTIRALVARKARAA